MTGCAVSDICCNFGIITSPPSPYRRVIGAVYMRSGRFVAITTEAVKFFLVCAVGYTCALATECFQIVAANFVVVKNRTIRSN